MILNERQHRITRAHERRLSKEIDQLRTQSDQRLTSAQRELLIKAGEDQLERLRGEVNEYRELSEGRISNSAIPSLAELPLALIRARIASGLTQAQFAERANMPEQQVQRYEATRYRGASLDRLRELAATLGLNVSGTAEFSAATQTLESHPEWRLAILILIIERVGRLFQRSVRGRLELQKRALLADRKLRERLKWRVFSFEPYRFGGYDPRIEDDVEVLEYHGLLRRDIRVSPSTDSANERVGFLPTDTAVAWIAEFAEGDHFAPLSTKREVIAAVDAVVRDVGDLSLRELLALTYERYPELSERSEIRDEIEDLIHRRRKRGSRR